MKPLLKVDGISSGYGDLKVVRDVGIEVHAGQTTALLGRNGAGKTTTLRAIAGLNSLSAGSIWLGDRDITKLSISRRIAEGLGFVQEGKRIFRRRTVLENVQLGGYSLGLRRKDLRRRVDEVLEHFPILNDRRNLTAGAMSGGQQQMLAIAQAIVPRPRVLMLDEPSTGLAPSIVDDVLRVVDDLRRQGLAVLLVEQELDFALTVSSRCTILDVGRVVHEGAASDPSVRAAAQAAYLGAATAPRP